METASLQEMPMLQSETPVSFGDLPGVGALGGVFLLLYATRYTPAGGRVIPILFGLFQVFLLALSTSAAVLLSRKSGPARPILLTHVGLFTGGLVLPAVDGLPAGYLQPTPFLFWLPRPALIALALIPALRRRRTPTLACRELR